MPGQDIRMSGTHWPKASQMPRCAKCFESMTAPESSALMPDGVVSYLWSCDSCGESVVTYCFSQSRSKEPTKAFL
jgi:hypothetical protein